MIDENASPPPPPVEAEPAADWPHLQLYRRVREAIAAMPIHFRTETRIFGISATDLHTLNSVLGATIEEQAVTTLNAMRAVWDPQGAYALYTFVRQSQTFPDVLLKCASTGEILMGIELKGWYLLAKEKEPSFRYKVTAAVCNPQDLIVVVPWVLDQVIGGSPITFTPYVASARYAAEYRTYYWRHGRKATKSEDRTIKFSPVTSHYPTSSEKILDVPVTDSGNFGRFARTGLMDTYIQQVDQRPLCGISVHNWRRFFKVFESGRDEDQLRSKLETLAKRIESGQLDIEEIADELGAIVTTTP